MTAALTEEDFEWTKACLKAALESQESLVAEIKDFQQEILRLQAESLERERKAFFAGRDSVFSSKSPSAEIEFNDYLTNDRRKA